MKLALQTAGVFVAALVVTTIVFDLGLTLAGVDTMPDTSGHRVVAFLSGSPPGRPLQSGTSGDGMVDCPGFLDNDEPRSASGRLDRHWPVRRHDDGRTHLGQNRA